MIKAIKAVQSTAVKSLLPRPRCAHTVGDLSQRWNYASSRRPSTSMASVRTALAETNDKGAFIRKDSVFRDFIQKGTRFEPEGESRVANASIETAFLRAVAVEKPPAASH